MLPFRRIAVAFAALLTAGCYDSRFGEPDGGASGEPATETIAALRAGDGVTLLAFLNSDWAYVETTIENQPCRAFIPRTALMEE